MRAVVAVVLPALMLAGCERGCLATWLQDHNAGGSSPGGSRDRDASRDLDLSGTDCSGGLARCVAGRVEISRTAHLPHPCTTPGTGPEKRGCECPWEPVGACDTGCSVDGYEVVATADVARTQLCRPDLPVARPFGAVDPPLAGVCSEEGIACVDGVVRSCESGGKPFHAFAVCASGCATEVGVLEGDAEPSVPLAGVAEILCRRAHAERR